MWKTNKLMDIYCKYRFINYTNDIKNYSHQIKRIKVMKNNKNETKKLITKGKLNEEVRSNREIVPNNLSDDKQQINQRKFTENIPFDVFDVLNNDEFIGESTLKVINDKESGEKTILRDNLSSEESFPASNLQFDINNSSDSTKDKEKDEKNEESKIDKNNFRYNELNMQMLSKKLHEQIFINTVRKGSLSDERISALKRELKSFGMKLDEATDIPDVDIDLPPLEGKDLEEHFFNIATNQTKPYLNIIDKIIGSQVPKTPDKWIFQEGWTRYENGKIERVDYPLEDGMIFDVEVCVKEGPLPTLATAVTDKAWYGWVSKSLVNQTSIPAESCSYTLDLLIPIESKRTEFGKKLNDHQKAPKVVIGHNVSFDRQRIKEQYWLNSTGTRFVDTMSLHISVSGMNSYQRSTMLANRDTKEDNFVNITSLNNLTDVYSLYCDKKHDKSTRDIFVEGSINDIVVNFNELMNYCSKDVVVTHEILRKLFPLFQQRFPHPVTFSGMLELGSTYLPINSNWQRYIEESESAFDDLNYEIKFTLSKRADQVCKLIHNDKYKEDPWMWDQDWSVQKLKMNKSSRGKTKKDSEQLLKKEEEEKEKKKELSDFEKYLTDDEDKVDELERKFSYLNDTKDYLPTRKPHMPGYPAWYRKLCMKENEENWLPGAQNISTSMKVTPKLLKLTWENYPLHYIREHGWGFLVPYNNNPDVKTTLPIKQLLSQCPFPKRDLVEVDTSLALTTLNVDVEKELHKVEFWWDQDQKSVKKHEKEQLYKSIYNGSGVWCNVDIDNCCWFFKLPHKDGPQMNVGNPLSKDFINKITENVLCGLDSSASEVIKIAKNVSYWRNNRDRIMTQSVFWLNDDDLTFTSKSKYQGKRFGAIIPSVVVCGTLTRRATEPTWMTASNVHEERVGSELRSMVQAPPNYSIVGADVDSQELWISSLIGDAYYAGIHGATPFGWMTLIGTKSNGTDMHSVTAKAIGISREHAKVINYARIYGAGLRFAERLLKQYNPTLSPTEAKSKASKMFNITKGKKMYELKSNFINSQLINKKYSSYEAYQIVKNYNKKIGDMFKDSGKWYGGSESAMFNKLEEIAQSKQPVTPFLNSRLSRALELDEKNKDKYLPTKINWVVQSGAVDFLHLMLVSMRWLMRDNAKFVLSFHDEIRYLVPTRYKYNAALAMHVTNLLTRSFCALRLGINDLPMSVAFFTSVEVDTALRKDSNNDYKTPSNPHGLDNGYGIPPGESLNIWDALNKSEGSLGSWHKKKLKRKTLKENEMSTNDKENNFSFKE